MKECPSCKAKVSEDCKFCTNCGTPLNEVKKEEKKEEVKVEETKVEEPKVNVQPTPAPQPSQPAKKGEGLGIASLVLGIIAIVISFISWLIIPAFLQVLLVLIGIILGIVNLAQGGKKFAGLIINGISIVTAIVSFVVFWVFIVSLLGLSINKGFPDVIGSNNSVVGYYKCASSKYALENDNYSMTINLKSDKNFSWIYTGTTNASITGTYTVETVEKDNAPANTYYYKVTMTGDKVMKDGKEIESSRGRINVYEVGVDKSGSKKELAMINESTYSMYYCVEG